MRILIAAILAVIALGGTAARAQDQTAAIQATIIEQIEAFKSEDPAVAFAFASPDVKRNFIDPKRFARMVRKDYPMVLHPKDVRFSALQAIKGLPVQGVIVTDESGQLHILDFEMIPGEEGWLVNAVRHRRGVDDSAA